MCTKLFPGYSPEKLLSGLEQKKDFLNNNLPVIRLRVQWRVRKSEKGRSYHLLFKKGGIFKQQYLSLTNNTL
jgi:hypothetical protein